LLLTRSKLFYLVLLVLISAGLRLNNLSQHFSHVDDLGVAYTIHWAQDQVDADANSSIFKRLKKRFKVHTVIPSKWTYAPFQFYFTPFLVHKDQTYRESLFWGRLPSTLFAIGSIVLFYLLITRNPESSLSLAFTVSLLMSFSWEHLIYSVHMSSYAIGVFALCLLMYKMAQYSELRSLSTKNIMGICGLGCLTFLMQYQMLFFIPGLFAAFFITEFLKNSFEAKKVFLRFLAAGSLFLIFFSRIFSHYLRHHTQGGVNWNAGPNKEFLFQIPDVSFGGKLSYFFQFFSENIFTSFNAMVNILPEAHSLYTTFGITLFVIFLIGCVQILKNSSAFGRNFKIFLLVSTLVWLLLILLQKLTLSPTRHFLILLPIFLYGVYFGLEFLIDKLPLDSLKTASNGILMLAVMGLFFSQYGVFTSERKDPFNEGKLVELLKQHQVQTVIQEHWTHNLNIMPAIKENFALFTPFWKKWEGQKPGFKRWAYIGHKADLTHRKFLKIETAMKAEGSHPFPHALDDYELIHHIQKHEGVEVERSSLTKNGGNNFFLRVYELKKPDQGKKGLSIHGQRALP